MKLTKSFLLKLDENLQERLSRQAERFTTSQSAVLRMALIKFLDEQERTQRENYREGRYGLTIRQ
jgi:predicted transcriptional regulator